MTQNDYVDNETEEICEELRNLDITSETLQHETNLKQIELEAIKRKKSNNSNKKASHSKTESSSSVG